MLITARWRSEWDVERGIRSVLEQLVESAFDLDTHAKSEMAKICTKPSMESQQHKHAQGNPHLR